MPDAYVIALALVTLLFLYVVYQRVRNGQTVSTSLLYVPLLLGIAWVFYTLWKDSQEIARLHSEVEKAREAEKDLRMRAKEAEIEGKKAELENQLSEAESAVKVLDERLRVEEKRHAKAVESAGRIRTWDDFWAAVGVSPGSSAGSSDPNPHP